MKFKYHESTIKTIKKLLSVKIQKKLSFFLYKNKEKVRRLLKSFVSTKKLFNSTAE